VCRENLKLTIDIVLLAIGKSEQKVTQQRRGGETRGGVSTASTTYNLFTRADWGHKPLTASREKGLKKEGCDELFGGGDFLVGKLNDVLPR
jgi:hypothetical protein